MKKKPGRACDLFLYSSLVPPKLHLFPLSLSVFFVQTVPSPKIAFLFPDTDKDADEVATEGGKLTRGKWKGVREKKRLSGLHFMSSGGEN